LSIGARGTFGTAEPAAKAGMRGKTGKGCRCGGSVTRPSFEVRDDLLHRGGDLQGGAGGGGVVPDDLLLGALLPHAVRHDRRHYVVAAGGEDEQLAFLQVGGAGDRVDGGDPRPDGALADADPVEELEVGFGQRVVGVTLDEVAAAEQDADAAEARLHL